MANAKSPEPFVLIPGRTSRQGTTLNEGKFSADYVQETSTLLMNPDDIRRLGLKNGDRVRLRPNKGKSNCPARGRTLLLEDTYAFRTLVHGGGCGRPSGRRRLAAAGR